MKRGFFEEYKNNELHDTGKEQKTRIIVQHSSFLRLIICVIRNIITWIFYLLVTVLSSVGFTVLINKSTRDMFVDFALKAFYGS